MACFLVPTGETVVVKAVEKAVEKREQNAGKEREKDGLMLFVIFRWDRTNSPESICGRTRRRETSWRSRMWR